MSADCNKKGTRLVPYTYGDLYLYYGMTAGFLMDVALR